MRFHSIIAVGALLFGTAPPALSHHSFSAEFDVGRPVNVTGTVSDVEWTNPHAWIFLEVADETNGTQSWAIELLGINSLMRRGLTRNTLKLGDVITVEGFGSRDGTNTANASVVIKTETGEELWRSAAGNRE